MQCIDSHNHLHFKEFDPDRNQVFSRARAAGVCGMLLVGIAPEDSRRALDMARMHGNQWAAVGIHPQMADTYTRADVMALDALAHDPKVVAVGETGFDLYRTPESIDLQRVMFEAHIDLALRHSLPLIIHDRDGHEQTLKTLDGCRGWDAGGVFHCFSGDRAMALRVVEKGFFVSIPGIVTFKNAQMLKDALDAVPLERLLVETDCPYLAPVPFRSKRNEPAYMVHTLKVMAEIKGVSPEEMASITTQNFLGLFGLGLEDE